MRAMILAAGRGARMGQLTDKTPKALLKVGNKFLIEYAIQSLVRANIQHIIINVSYHADQIMATIGDGERYGVNITYSYEEEALETGGGIINALPLLGSQPFVVLSADVICDYPLNQLPAKLTKQAHLVLVNNPVYNSSGDFSLFNGIIVAKTMPNFTYANVGIFHPQIFAGFTQGKIRLAEILKLAIANGEATGELYQGPWCNVGTPQQLNQLNLGEPLHS